jgi:hypothetical protein
MLAQVAPLDFSGSLGGDRSRIGCRRLQVHMHSVCKARRVRLRRHDRSACASIDQMLSGQVIVGRRYCPLYASEKRDELRAWLADPSAGPTGLRCVRASEKTTRCLELWVDLQQTKDARQLLAATGQRSQRRATAVVSVETRRLGPVAKPRVGSVAKKILVRRENIRCCICVLLHTFPCN